jgi:hypothetical protein
MTFMGFRKNKVQFKIQRLAFDFIKNVSFVAKNDRNSISHDHEGHIPHQLYIIVIYKSFNGF